MQFTWVSALTNSRHYGLTCTDYQARQIVSPEGAFFRPGTPGYS